MALFDLPLDELRAYRSASAEPEDFDAFWDRTLTEAREHEPAVAFEPVDTGLSTVRCTTSPSPASAATPSRDG